MVLYWPGGKIKEGEKDGWEWEEREKQQSGKKKRTLVLRKKQEERQARQRLLATVCWWQGEGKGNLYNGKRMRKVSRNWKEK